MAGGPIAPYSAMPDDSGEVFPSVRTQNSRVEEGWAHVPSLASDRKLHLRWMLPPTLPSGTLKLVIVSSSNGSSGTTVVEPLWVSADPDGEDAFNDLTYTGEGDTTITYTAADDYVETKITLDADTAVGGELLAMELKFDATSSTSSAQFHNFFLIWE